MRYRSKPTEIEAVQWQGDNWQEVYAFAGDKASSTVHNPGSEAVAGEPLQLFAGKDGAQGWVDVPIGHWIVSQPGDRSDIWPVENDYFAAKYEPVNTLRIGQGVRTPVSWGTGITQSG